MQTVSICFTIMLSILSLNAKGLVSENKQLCLQQYAQNQNSSILFLQETNLLTSTPVSRALDYVFLINPPVQPASGVAIAIKNQLYQQTKILQQLSPVPGYLQAVQAEINNYVHHFINVYMPHDSNAAVNVINKINQYLTTTKEDSIVIIGGDWNVTLTKEDRRNCTELKTQLANQLQVLVQQYNLTDIWREFHPQELQFTYRGHQNNFPMARLDRFYIQNKDMHLVQSSKIIPSFSDHDGLRINLHTAESNYRTAYWKFDPTSLQSNDYIYYIKNIISHYQEKSENPNSNICLIWDRLKEEISAASQRFTKQLNQETKQKLTTLISTLDYIDKKEELSRSDSQLMLQIRKEISSIYKARASEKLNFLQSQVIQEANMQSKFFLRLAKQNKPSSIINQIRVNGNITTNKNVIYPEVQRFFQNQFSENVTNQIDTESIVFQELPSLNQTDSEKCEQIITQEEIHEAIKSAKLNRASGMDGLPIEFYKFFWDDIKTLLTKLIKNFQQTGELPLSMKKIVVTPIPKPGDRTELKNWRPISLMNCDYKIITRIFGRKIADVISSLLTSDQSYCVPGRTIYNNLHLIRNIIRHANRTNSPLAVLALDQQGAFNNISHEYLHQLLKIHKFGPTMTQSILALLNQTKGYVKIGSTLLAPFVFKKGFRQGDPIAGPLYVLSIEPFLRLATKMMASIGYPIPNSNFRITSTGFADDVHFFISENQQFQLITDAFNLYSRQSGALLNTTKSKGLFCGAWKTRDDKPLQSHWSTEGLKVLGVYIGNSQQWEYENWKTLIIKLKGTLNNWSRFLKTTSYLGRKIICNQLAGSQLIHTLNVLHPPKEFLQEVQKAMVNFIWQGKHWLHPNFLYAPIEDGGLGLTHLEAKVKSLRLKLIQDLQNNHESQEPGFLFHHYNMALYGNSKPLHFFMKKRDQIEMANLDNFYLNLLNAWYDIKPSLATSKFPLRILRETPLNGSMIIDTNQVKILNEWSNNGFTNLGDLLTPHGTWANLQLQNLTSSIQRRLTLNYNNIKNYFGDKILPQQDEHQLILFKFIMPNASEPRIFPATRKQHYNAYLHKYLEKPEVTGKPKWLDKKITWTQLYTYPSDRRDSNTAWRLLHNALVTPRRLHQWKIIPSSLCTWCQQEGNLPHMFFQCKEVKQLWNFVSRKIAAINNTQLPSYEQLLVGFPADTPAGKLSNFLLVLAKDTIYRSYMNVIKERNPPNPQYLSFFKRRLNYRLTLQENYAQITRTQDNFRATFMINNALQSMQNG